MDGDLSMIGQYGVVFFACLASGNIHCNNNGELDFFGNLRQMVAETQTNCSWRDHARIEDELFLQAGILKKRRLKDSGRVH